MQGKKNGMEREALGEGEGGYGNATDDDVMLVRVEVLERPLLPGIWN